MRCTCAGKIHKFPTRPCRLLCNHSWKVFDFFSFLFNFHFFLTSSWREIIRKLRNTFGWFSNQKLIHIICFIIFCTYIYMCVCVYSLFGWSVLQITSFFFLGAWAFHISLHSCKLHHGTRHKLLITKLKPHLSLQLDWHSDWNIHH